MQRLLVDRDVDAEAGVLHGVQGEVLHAGHGVALHAAREGGAQLADVERVLAVRLLRPTPGRVAQHVHAHAAVEVGADGAQLAADGVADALLEVDVPRRAAGHAHREAGGRADDHAARPVGEVEAGDAEPVDLGRGERAPVVAALAEVVEPGPERQVAVEAPAPLVGRHQGDEVGGLGGGVGPRTHPPGRRGEGGVRHRGLPAGVGVAPAPPPPRPPRWRRPPRRRAPGAGRGWAGRCRWSTSAPRWVGRAAPRWAAWSSAPGSWWWWTWWSTSSWGGGGRGRGPPGGGDLHRHEVRHVHRAAGREVQAVATGVGGQRGGVPVGDRDVGVRRGDLAHDLVGLRVVRPRLADGEEHHVRDGRQGVDQGLEPRLVDAGRAPVVGAELHDDHLEPGAVPLHHGEPLLGAAVDHRVDGDLPALQVGRDVAVGAGQHAVADHQGGVRRGRRRGPTGGRSGDGRRGEEGHQRRRADEGRDDDGAWSATSRPSLLVHGRAGGIRTRGLLLPKQAR